MVIHTRRGAVLDRSRNGADVFRLAHRLVRVAAPAAPPSPAAVPATRLRVLGGFELRVGQRLLIPPVYAQRLLAFLAVRERPQLRSTAAVSLWLDTTDAKAAANLRTALWKIRQLADDVVQVNGNYIALGDHVSVDLSELTYQARQLINPGVASLPPTIDATASPDAFCGDLLPDWDEEWIHFERERLRQMRCHALEALCRRLTHCDRHAEAIDAGQAAVAAEPLRESAHAALIAAHLAEGNLSEARRQFALYRALLADALQLQPSVELQQLVDVACSPDSSIGRASRR